MVIVYTHMFRLCQFGTVPAPRIWKPFHLAQANAVHTINLVGIWTTNIAIVSVNAVYKPHYYKARMKSTRQPYHTNGKLGYLPKITSAFQPQTNTSFKPPG